MAQGYPPAWIGRRRDMRDDQVFAALEQTPDLSRGEVRFAAEALLETVRGTELPEDIMNRALSIAGVMARG